MGMFATTMKYHHVFLFSAVLKRFGKNVFGIWFSSIYLPPTSSETKARPFHIKVMTLSYSRVYFVVFCLETKSNRKYCKS